MKEKVGIEIKNLPSLMQKRNRGRNQKSSRGGDAAM